MKRVLTLFSITLVLLFVSGWVLLFFLPKPPLLAGVHFSTAIYDHQDHLLRLTLSQDEKYRLFTPYPRISQELMTATLLQEDQYFYQHYGLNPFSILKAAWQTYVVKTRRVGASTITMQVARLRYGIHSKTLSGKLLQIARALQLEMHYSKHQILEAYLNLAPYGNNIEGIGAASLIYFGKQARNMTLPEALILSVIPQNPTKRTPQNINLKDIRDKLFARWAEEHPEDRHKKSMIELPLALRNLQSLPFIAPHFVNTVLKDSTHQPQDIRTTLDVHLQSILGRVTHHYLSRKTNIGAYNAAVMLVDVRDMGVKGLIGSASFFNTGIEGQINGTQIKRSPGSTLKPFIYGLALDQGFIHPNTVLKDVPHSFGAYNPENFDYDFMGPLRARDALVLSRNIPALYLAHQLKHPNLYALLESAQTANLKPESFYGLSLALGGVELSMRELVGLYAMLVNDGMWHPIRLREDTPFTPGKRLLSPEASFLVLDMLKDTQRPDTAFLKHDAVVSWKTGTSSGFRDAWTVGAFGPYVMAVWIGNFNNKGNPAFVGKNLAAPLFFELMNALHQALGSFPVITRTPASLNLEKVDVCKASGMLPTRYCKDTESTWFIPGKSPIKTDTIYREIAVNKQTGLRTCHFNDNTRFEIYEFWPTDLLKIFKQAGIQRRIPPPFEPNCSLTSSAGLSPQITSPQTELRYIVSAHSPETTKIPLTAVTDADVRSLYWFLNEIFIAKTLPDEPFLWPAKAGKFVVRVVDDHGLSDARDITVQVNG